MATFNYSLGFGAFLLRRWGLKGLAYAMDKPCREILYVPTNRVVQFKAKSWIDTAGSRSGKAIGSMMITLFPYEQLLHSGGAIYFGLLATWVPIAWWLGRKNRHLIATDTLIH